MWDGLMEICRRQGVTVHQIATLVDRCRHRSSLTAKLRVFIFSYFRKASTEAGHAQAGHGRVTPPSAFARNPGGKRVRRVPTFTGTDTIYQAVYAQLAKLDARRSESRSTRKDGSEAV